MFVSYAKVYLATCLFEINILRVFFLFSTFGNHKRQSNKPNTFILVAPVGRLRSERATNNATWLLRRSNVYSATRFVSPLLCPEERNFCVLFMSIVCAKAVLCVCVLLCVMLILLYDLVWWLYSFWWVLYRSDIVWGIFYLWSPKNLPARPYN